MDRDTTCKCDKCGREKNVVFAQCILAGWPRCCNQRMTVKETRVDLDTVVAQVVAPIEALINEAIRKR